MTSPVGLMPLGPHSPHIQRLAPLLRSQLSIRRLLAVGNVAILKEHK
jgi:hypothetical protein